MEMIELVAPFHLSLPIYEPRSYIDPDNRHPYDDKTRKIFYNVSRYQDVEDPEVKDFLRYLENKTPTNDFTRRLDQMVEELKIIEMGFSDYIAARQKEFDWLRQGKKASPSGWNGDVPRVGKREPTRPSWRRHGHFFLTVTLQKKLPAARICP